MWFTRLIFTFNYKKHQRWSIALYGGFSITLIFYFLIAVSLKNAPIVQNSPFGAFVREQPDMLVLYSLAISTVLVQILHWLGVNIFRIIVLLGTFSLAMAFAGNDLVNFIGVPLAGLESYLDFSHAGAGVTASTHKMNVLLGDSSLPYVQLFLIGAGVIMTVAIWTSKKAQQVVQRTIDLSSQSENEEVFSSSKVARRTVRNVLTFNSYVAKHVPVSVANWVNERFSKEEVTEENAAFDLVRASVNLVLAGLLVIIGTTFKLPLSTTYVAFMIAMGSSLADRAWGRETAVYRITGVMTVIGGWFITAGAAFMMAFLIATLNNVGGFFAMVGVIGLIIFTMITNNRRFKKKQEQAENVDTLFRQMMSTRDKQETWSLLLQHCQLTEVHLIKSSREIFEGAAQGLMNDNIRTLRSAESLLKDEREMWKRYRRKEIIGMRKIDRLQAIEKDTWFYLGINSISQILYGLKRMLEPILEHVDNNFSPLPEDFINEYAPVVERTSKFLVDIQTAIENNDFSTSDEVLVNGSILKNEVSAIRHSLQDRIQRDESNLTVALLYLSTLQETQEIISNARHLLRAAKRFSS